MERDIQSKNTAPESKSEVTLPQLSQGDNSFNLAIESFTQSGITKFNNQAMMRLKDELEYLNISSDNLEDKLEGIIKKAGLKERQKTVVKLHLLEGKTIANIASELSISQNATNSVYQDSKRKIIRAITNSTLEQDSEVDINSSREKLPKLVEDCKELNQNQRDVLIMRISENNSFSEIEKKLNLKKGTASIYYNNGLRKILSKQQELNLSSSDVLYIGSLINQNNQKK
jgi:DNA-directed RNA polymerase specialized sigma24 family protein